MNSPINNKIKVLRSVEAHDASEKGEFGLLGAQLS